MGFSNTIYIHNLTTILEQVRHFFILVEHDPLLHENAAEITEYVPEALRQTSI